MTYSVSPRTKGVYRMLRLMLLWLLLIASLAILNCQPYTTGLQKSVVRADEVSALATLHSLAAAQRSYFASNGAYASFQQLAAAEFMDSRFNADKPQTANYVYSMDVKPQRFSCNADPVLAGEQAGRHLYIDSDSAEIHVNATRPATASDPVFQP